MEPLSASVASAASSPWAQYSGLKAKAPALDALPGAGGMAPAAPAAAPTATFGNVLGDLVRGVHSSQQQAGQLLSMAQAGQGVPLHQAMIASEEAGVSFQLMLEVRNKLLEGYQELMRMQV